MCVCLLLVAVSGRHHPVLVDQGATTEVVARVQRHLMGLGVGLALIASDDLVVLRGNWKHTRGQIVSNRGSIFFKMQSLEVMNTRRKICLQAAPMSRTKTRDLMVAVWSCRWETCFGFLAYMGWFLSSFPADHVPEVTFDQSGSWKYYWKSKYLVGCGVVCANILRGWNCIICKSFKKYVKCNLIHLFVWKNLIATTWIDWSLNA